MQNERALSSRTRELVSERAHGRNRENHATLEESIERERRIRRVIWVCMCLCVCLFFWLSEAGDGVVAVMRKRGGEWNREGRVKEEEERKHGNGWDAYEYQREAVHRSSAAGKSTHRWSNAVRFPSPGYQFLQVCMYVLFACGVLAPGSSFLNPCFKNSLQAIRKNGKNPLLPRTLQFSFCIINNNSRRIITLVF